MTPKDVKAITDPLERARAAGGFIDRANEAVSEVIGIRDAAIVDLLIAGRSQRAVAAELGVSSSLVAGVAKTRNVTTARVARVTPSRATP